MRAQGSVELLLWVSVSMLVFAFCIAAFGKGFAQLAPASANLELGEFLATVISSADSMGTHGVHIMRIRIPHGISEFAVEEDGEEWNLRVTANNIAFSRALPFRLIVYPQNMTAAPGLHVVRISWHGDALFVEEIDNSEV